MRAALRRVIQLVVVLLCVSFFSFALLSLAPGDPVVEIVGFGSPAQLARIRHQLHFDRPFLTQYWEWLTGLLHGDLGRSLAANEAVTMLLRNRLENSAVLVLLAAVISTPLAILLGAVTARRRDSPLDHGASVTMLVLAALPEFVVGIGLVLLLGTTVFTVLPAVSLIPPDSSPWHHLNELVLPTLTLVIAVFPYTARIMRASMVEVLESDYVEMARLKGMPEQKVLWRHSVPNGIAPTIQVIALNLAYLAGGIVVVEFVFGYPGIGAGFVDAVANRDLPVVQALAIVIAAVYVFLNVAADVATILVSPRLRTSLK